MVTRTKNESHSGTNPVDGDRSAEVQALLERRAELVSELNALGARVRALEGIPDAMHAEFTRALVEHCHRAKQAALRE